MHAVLDPTYTPMIEDNLFIYGLVESDRTYLRLKGIDTYRVTYAGFFYKFKAALRSMKARYPDDYMYQPLYVRSK